MEIMGNYSVNLGAYVRQDRYEQKEEAASGDANKAAPREDKVELSPQAKEVRKAAEELKSLPDIREKKVADIKASITNGTYSVDGKETALRMMKDSLVNGYF
ncbi:MAG: flagellar biosynthesis anti-sigma factor FlgM [Desulfobacterales bacterium]|nr:flagellar biosynthesis anti-sigma factor FlgM [Desulfobacterales bacterium]